MLIMDSISSFVMFFLPSYLDLEAVPAGDRMLHSNGVFDLHQAAPVRQIVEQLAGLDIDRQFPKGRLIQGGVLFSLLKHHLGVYLAGTGQNDP